MTAITFDTLKFVRRLRDAGVDEKQAEAFSEAIKEVQESQLKELATKGDLALLKADLRDLEYRMTIRLGGLMIAGFSALGVLMKLH
ncbi:MAG: DUF1640 domain-containing protein [Magnetococcales bacterium]|nr:DUF1640 domain-containing protein [Magnetococcales bacterium]